MRMRKKPNLAKRLDKCSHLLVPEPDKHRGRWLAEYNGYNQLHIELGCGKGLFTTATAHKNPGVFIAALEKSADAMIIALERADAEGLQNVRFLNALADNITEYFAPGEVFRIYINFCDPWPARRHEKRRLTYREFLEFYRQILAPGGEIHFKTDNLPLFEFSLGEFENCGFNLTEITHDLHKDGPRGIMTDYETRFYNQGIPIKRCVAGID